MPATSHGVNIDTICQRRKESEPNLQDMVALDMVALAEGQTTRPPARGQGACSLSG